MSNLNKYARDVIAVAVDAVVGNVQAESLTTRLTDLVLSKKFPVEAFSAPKKDERGEVPFIKYDGGSVNHPAFWKGLKLAVAETLPEHDRPYAVHDKFNDYLSANFKEAEIGKMPFDEREKRKDRFREARQRINPRIAHIRKAIEKAYRADSEPTQTTPEQRAIKSLVSMSERIGKMEVTSKQLLDAKRHIDAAIAALKAE